jgi:hypothetical protein
MQLKQVRDNFQRYGLAAGLHDVGKRAVNKVLPVRVLRAVLLQAAAIPCGILEHDAKLRCGFATEDEILAACADELDLAEPFARDALARGDRCYGVWDGDRLVSYGWYSRRPTLISEDERLCFDPAYVYMYKGYTLPEYRGHRLHALGMARALVAYTAEEQVRGMVSYVESHNFASLRSCHRLGYVEIGSIYLVTAPGGARLSWTTGRCAELGLRVEVV